MQTYSGRVGLSSWKFRLAVAVGTLFLVCCGGGGGGGGGGDTQEPTQTGVLNGPCFTDGTCDGVLVCRNDVCVEPPDSDDDGSVDTGGGGIGSACGSCDPGLTCVSDAPGGYCSKSCARHEDCGADAYCYATESYGSVCLAACERDDDCRQGYTCQGDPGLTVCYPAPDGDVPQGNYTNASFFGCYALNYEIEFRLLFDGVNRFADIQWTPLSGEIRYAGTYQVSGNQITFYYSDGDVKQYSFTMIDNGFNMDGYHYYVYDQGCE